MIWKNPFLIRQAEGMDTAKSFLRMFSPDALTSILRENSFNTIKFIRSSPGAGKTTIFKAMQSNILKSLQNQESTKDFFEIATKYKMIESGEVKLLSCILSCAKNYGLIDQLFQNGRKQQVLFALFNVRLTVLMLKSIMDLKGFREVQELEKITFVDVPEECFLIASEISNGYKLFTWAQAEERKICHYLDALSDEKTNFSFIYDTLFLIRLFEPHNILFEKQTFLNHSLIIFDDVQELTKSQREQLTNTLLTMRPNLGIWIGERLEALSPDEIITNSGATVGREYEPIILLEEYWQNDKSKFKRALSNIAERRVGLHSPEIGSFENCLENNLDLKKHEKSINVAIESIKEKMGTDINFGTKYIPLFQYIDSKNVNLYDQAVAYVVLDIKYRRDVAKGQMYMLNDEYTIEEFTEFHQENANVAHFYLSVQAGLPYYYGLEKIKDISSYNIEQFLAFSGSVFEQYVSKEKFITRSKRSSPLSVTPEEQEKFIYRVAKRRYDEIPRLFHDGESIQNLLHNLSRRSLQTRDKGTNSYAGGAVTGVAINRADLSKLLESERYEKLKKVLSACISSNYFEKRTVTHSNREWIVLYYNRWLCVYYGLPLVYGGWFRATLDELNMYLEKADVKAYNTLDNEVLW